MKRNNDIYMYGHAFRQQHIAETLVTPPEPKEVVQSKHDPQDSFLRLVYALDPLTKLPTGDLQYMVSDKANPEVKQWVLQNLLIDTSSAAIPAAPKGLSDDDIAALARSPKESVQSYMERVNQYMNVNKQAYERMVNDVRASMAKRNDVPDRSFETPVSAE